MGQRRQRVQSGDQRRRLLRHHVPLALGSAVVLALFMTLPTFDTSANHGAVDISTGAFPQPRAEREPTDHGANESRPMDHDGAEGQPAVHGTGTGTDHARDQRDSTDHGGRSQGTTPDRTAELTASRSLVQRFTVATGYVATGLLALTLLIGPANLLLRRRRPVSSYLRRDVGTWTAIFSVVHVIYGLQVHAPLSDFASYFLAPDGSPLTNSFGLGNWTGLLATVIVIGLLALSSDFALRKLSARPWKQLQRLNYALFALAIAHAFFYGALLRTTSPFTLLLGLTVVAVFVAQALGIWLWRRRYARTAVRSA